jgi:hypothetical protein
MRRIVAIIASVCAFLSATDAAAADFDWSRVDQVFGKPGSLQPGGIHRWGLPRTDLTIMVDGVVLKPTLALGTWIAFQPIGGGAMVMGDLVLTETEVSPVMKRLIEGGIEITALHNHLLRTFPAVFYMHVGGHGDPVKLAETLRAGLALSRTPIGAPPAATPPASMDLDVAGIEGLLEIKGTANGGVYQFAIPRAEPITEAGVLLPPALGVATAINFQPTGAGKAAVTGDFVLLSEEVTPVLKSLRDDGIEVTAIHSHMLDEAPRLVFMHFWAVDDARMLAERLRRALDMVKRKRDL